MSAQKITFSILLTRVGGSWNTQFLPEFTNLRLLGDKGGVPDCVSGVFIMKATFVNLCILTITILDMPSSTWTRRQRRKNLPLVAEGNSRYWKKIIQFRSLKLEIYRSTSNNNAYLLQKWQCSSHYLHDHIKGTQAWNFFSTFFPETETLWSQGPVRGDCWK